MAGKLMHEVFMRLKKLGVRLTPQRQEVLRVLLEGALKKRGQPLSAEEILHQVRQRYPGISFDTVYRTLATFRKLGLVHEVLFRDGCRRFELNLRGEHYHHLVCLKCGRARELPFCPADCLARAREHYPDFEIADHAFTIYGYCARCREA